MANVVVIGTQWGDEGKGKIVDCLAAQSDAVIRFQGGHNAGHTLVVGDNVYKLSLLPSGVVQGKLGLIGNGVVVDPQALHDEIVQIESQGIRITPHNLKIAENVPLILPVHPALDKAREYASKKDKIGTTGRGIGPAYEDKIGRRAIRLCDLQEPELLSAKIDKLLDHHNILLKGLGAQTFSKEDIMSFLRRYGPTMLTFKDMVWKIIERLQRQGKRLLFEGAQAVMLDIDQGTYPFVTSSNTVASNVGTGAGCGARTMGHVLGIVKAYCTRVGQGPFPTQQDNEIGEILAKRGHEYGTNTGRKRRCGWLDLALLRYAITVGGIDSLALMKMDVLDTLPEIKLAVGYVYKGEKCDALPYGAAAQQDVQPIYETFEGWQENTHGVRRKEDLPAKALKFIHRIEEICDVPVSIISTSPHRDDTIYLQDI